MYLILFLFCLLLQLFFSLILIILLSLKEFILEIITTTTGLCGQKPSEAVNLPELFLLVFIVDILIISIVIILTEIGFETTRLNATHTAANSDGAIEALDLKAVLLAEQALVHGMNANGLFAKPTRADIQLDNRLSA